MIDVGTALCSPYKVSDRIFDECVILYVYAFIFLW